MNFRYWAAAAASMLTFTGAAQAALIDRGGGMIYDDVLNITWLQNWNQAVGSAYDTVSPGSGLMDWRRACRLPFDALRVARRACQRCAARHRVALAASVARR